MKYSLLKINYCTAKHITPKGKAWLIVVKAELLSMITTVFFFLSFVFPIKSILGEEMKLSQIHIWMMVSFFSLLAWRFFKVNKSHVLFYKNCSKRERLAVSIIGCVLPFLSLFLLLYLGLRFN
jgi:hypothetical protein